MSRINQYNKRAQKPATKRNAKSSGSVSGSARKQVGVAQGSGITGWSIGVQMMDTAWRVALPIFVLTIIGAKLDKNNGTQPLYTLVGLFLSLATASLLVYRQIKLLYPEFVKRGGKKK